MAQANEDPMVQVQNLTVASGVVRFLIENVVEVRDGEREIVCVCVSRNRHAPLTVPPTPPLTTPQAVCRWIAAAAAAAARADTAAAACAAAALNA